MEDEVAYNLVREVSAAQKTKTESANSVKRHILRNADISDNAKSVVYYGMLATEKEQKLMDELESRADMGIVTMALMQIKDAGEMSGAAANTRKLKALIDNRLSTAVKLQIYREMISEDTEDIEDVVAAGIGFDDYMRFKIDIYGLSSDSGGTKKEKVLRIIDRMDLNKEQKDEMYFAAGYKETTLKKDAPWW